MPSKVAPLTAACIGIAAIAVFFIAGEAQAGSTHRKHVVVVHPRPSPYAPYYYSRWNPYSLYSVYDHLSGGRQLCYLPSEPCDDGHTVHN